MTNPRVKRASNLGNEFLGIMQRLGEGLSGPGAVLFLDRRARCHAFSDDELQQAGVTDILALGDELWRTDGGLLAQVAADALDLDGLRQRAFAAAAGEAVDVLALAMDALLVATVAGVLPLDPCEHATAVCEDVVAAVAAAPAVFEAAAAVALDRARYERPSRLPPLARELLGALRATSRLASYDAEHEHDTVPPQADEQMEAAVNALRTGGR